MGLVMGPDGKVRLVPDAQPAPQMPAMPGRAGGPGAEKAVLFPPTLAGHVLDYLDRINGRPPQNGGGSYQGPGLPQSGASYGLLQGAIGGQAPGGPAAPARGGVMDQLLNGPPALGSFGPDGQVAPPAGGDKTIGALAGRGPL